MERFECEDTSGIDPQIFSFECWSMQIDEDAFQPSVWVVAPSRRHVFRLLGLYPIDGGGAEHFPPSHFGEANFSGHGVRKRNRIGIEIVVDVERIGIEADACIVFFDEEGFRILCAVFGQFIVNASEINPTVPAGEE